MAAERKEKMGAEVNPELDFAMGYLMDETGVVSTLREIYGSRKQVVEEVARRAISKPGTVFDGEHVMPALLKDSENGSSSSEV